MKRLSTSRTKILDNPLKYGSDNPIRQLPKSTGSDNRIYETLRSVYVTEQLVVNDVFERVRLSNH